MRISSSASCKSRSRVTGSRKRRRTPRGRNDEDFRIRSPWLEQTVHRGDVVLPARDFGAELFAAFRGEGVVLRAAVVLGHAPFGVHGAGVLETVERFVERRVDDAEVAAGAVDRSTC